jgi:hypothetical protein
VTTRPVRDFGFHPDEDDVRVFACQPAGVLCWSSDAYVSAARYGDLVLWHYAFARYEQFVDELTGTAALSGQRVKIRAARPAAV